MCFWQTFRQYGSKVSNIQYQYLPQKVTKIQSTTILRIEASLKTRPNEFESMAARKDNIFQ